MKAPNGKPSYLTEKQWLQVRTPEFKAWFGEIGKIVQKQQVRWLRMEPVWWFRRKW